MRKIVCFIRHPEAASKRREIMASILTLLVEQLRLTPAERARKLEQASTALEQVRGAARSANR